MAQVSTDNKNAFYVKKRPGSKGHSEFMVESIIGTRLNILKLRFQLVVSHLK
jgi:hypothetical protein